MSSGVQRYQGPSGEVEAVRFDGTNRSQIEQWLADKEAEIDWTGFDEGARWCILMPGLMAVWVNDMMFDAEYSVLPPGS